MTLRHTPYCLYVTVASDDTVDFLSPGVSDAIATKTEIKQKKRIRNPRTITLYLRNVLSFFSHSLNVLRFVEVWEQQIQVWSVRRHWLRSSSVSPSEYSRISSRPLQTCRSSWVWLRSSSSPRAPERDWASSGLTWARNWSSRGLSQLNNREQEMLYIHWMLLYWICV